MYMHVHILYVHTCLCVYISTSEAINNYSCEINAGIVKQVLSSLVLILHINETRSFQL